MTVPLNKFKISILKVCINFPIFNNCSLALVHEQKA